VRGGCWNPRSRSMWQDERGLMNQDEAAWAMPICFHPDQKKGASHRAKNSTLQTRQR
jgi:hypothetical protein